MGVTAPGAVAAEAVTPALLPAPAPVPLYVCRLAAVDDGNAKKMAGAIPALDAYSGIPAADGAAASRVHE